MYIINKKQMNYKLNKNMKILIMIQKNSETKVQKVENLKFSKLFKINKKIKV